MKSSRLKKSISRVGEVVTTKKTDTAVHYRMQLGNKCIQWIETFGDAIKGHPYCFEKKGDEFPAIEEADGWFPKTIEEILEWFKKA